MLVRNIIDRTSPHMAGVMDVRLSKNALKQSVWQKGYDVYYDKILKCPCISTGTDAARSTCQNCGGYGVLVIERIKTKMLLHNLNLSNELREWGDELSGSVSITCIHEDRLKIGDRITLLEGSSYYNEVISVKKYDDKLFSFLFYEPISILGVYKFVSDGEKLLKLKDDSYEIKNEHIRFLDEVEEGDNISIIYSYKPQYIVIDLGRDIVISDTFGPGRTRVKQDYPLSAVGKKVHMVIDKPDFDGYFLLDNTVKDLLIERKVNGDIITNEEDKAILAR